MLTAADSVSACAMADVARPSGATPGLCTVLPRRRSAGLLNLSLFNPAVSQRHFLRGFNHQRAKLGDPIVGHT